MTDTPVSDTDSAEAMLDDSSGLSQAELARMTQQMVACLKEVYDPEIPVDIYELGLIYRIDVNAVRHVEVDMTLTAPGCPVAEDMVVWVHDAVMRVDGIHSAKVNLVFDPPWDISLMSDEARLQLNLF